MAEIGTIYGVDDSQESNWSCRNERDDHDDLNIPFDDDQEDDEDEKYDQGDGEESPDLLDIPVMSRAWTGIEETMRANMQDDGGYQLVTFGLGVEELGRRDLTVQSLDPHVLRSALYATWEDCVPQFATLEIHLVMPQPLVELQIEKAVILIVEIFVDDDYQEQRPCSRSLAMSVMCYWPNRFPRLLDLLHISGT